MKHGQIDVDPMEAAAEEAAGVLKNLSNPSRLKILCALVQKDQTVSELEKIVGASQSYVSRQLMRLRDEQIVNCNRDGRIMRYYISDPRVRPILECLYDVFCPEI